VYIIRIQQKSPPRHWDHVNVHEECFWKQQKVSKRECRDYVNKHRWEVSCSRRLRKQTRKCRDHANTEIDWTTTEINAKWSISSAYIWRILFNMITETKTTISRSTEYSRRILFKTITKINAKMITLRWYRWSILLKMNTETDAKMISRGYKWNMLFKMNTKIDAKMMVLNEYRWSILVKMNTEKTRKWWYYVDIDEASWSRWIRK